MPRVPAQRAGRESVRFQGTGNAAEVLLTGGASTKVPKMIETSARQRSTADLLRYLAERLARMFQDWIADTAESSLAWPKRSEHWHERKAADPGPAPARTATWQSAGQPTIRGPTTTPRRA